MGDLSEWLTVTEAAERYRLTRKGVDQAVRAGRIEVQHKGAQILVSAAGARELWGYRLNPAFEPGARGRPTLPKRWRRKRRAE